MGDHRSASYKGKIEYYEVHKGNIVSFKLYNGPQVLNLKKSNSLFSYFFSILTSAYNMNKYVEVHIINSEVDSLSVIRK